MADELPEGEHSKTAIADLVLLAFSEGLVVHIHILPIGVASGAFVVEKVDATNGWQSKRSLG